MEEEVRSKEEEVRGKGWVRKKSEEVRVSPVTIKKRTFITYVHKP